LKTTSLKALLVAAALVVFAAESPLSPELSTVLDSISADSLRGDVSFLASDLLEGRATPSRGQDIAAEYIASQFRRAGLEAGGDDGYFQTAKVTPPARNRAPDAPPPEPVTLRNVIAVLHGSDPGLKETCVILSAHYDHLGARPVTDGDGIYNGANDDASGTAAVLEISSALARLRPAAKRSVVFVAFSGEERGALGSRYYAQHPVFPPEKTVADINLEQVGRTDDVTGPVVLTAYVTGFDYSDVGPILQKAGEAVGVTITKHTANSDKFFTQSDNRSLAETGIPAHTVSVGFIFPDYHAPGDEWQKLDYDNMEKIVRAVALGVYRIAASDTAPRWNPENPRAERYRKLRETQPEKP
jgi:Zn-dependent M28 family amino/carboxypeptidase